MLTELQYLDNLDKHRFVIESSIVPAVLLGYEKIAVEWTQWPRVESGAYLATVLYPPGYEGVQVKPAFTADICVQRSNGVGFLPAVWFADQLVEYVERKVLSQAVVRFP